MQSCSQVLGVIKFASEGDRGSVVRFIGRLRRSGYLPKDAPTVAEILNEAVARLFRSVSIDVTVGMSEKAPNPSKRSQV